MAVARCSSIGRLRIGIALEPLFKDDDRLVELSQGYSRLGQKIEREVRMERIEPLAGIDRIDRYRGATVAYQNCRADTLRSASSADTRLRPLDIPTNMSVNVRCSSDTGTGRSWIGQRLVRPHEG